MLSGKTLISPLLNEALLERVFWLQIFCLFFECIIHHDISCNPFWPAKFLIKNSLIASWTFLCIELSFFSLAAFKNFFFITAFCHLNYCASWRGYPSVDFVVGSLCLLDLDTFLSQIRQVFRYYFFTEIFCPFIPSSFGILIMWILFQLMESLISLSLILHNSFSLTCSV